MASMQSDCRSDQHSGSVLLCDYFHRLKDSLCCEVEVVKEYAHVLLLANGSNLVSACAAR